MLVDLLSHGARGVPMTAVYEGTPEDDEAHLLLIYLKSKMLNEI